MDLWLASGQEKPALARAYAADLAELLPGDDPQASEGYVKSYWQEPGQRFPYLFGRSTSVGFAFVRLPEEPDLDFEMAEFCVYRAVRRMGIGSAVLPLLFHRHPGRWEVSVLMTNDEGLAFWPKALKAAQVRNLRMREDDVARGYRFITL